MQAVTTRLIFQKKKNQFLKFFEEAGGRERVYTNKQDRKKNDVVLDFSHTKNSTNSSIVKKNIIIIIMLFFRFFKVK